MVYGGWDRANTQFHSHAAGDLHGQTPPRWSFASFAAAAATALFAAAASVGLLAMLDNTWGSRYSRLRHPSENFTLGDDEKDEKVGSRPSQNTEGRSQQSQNAEGRSGARIDANSSALRYGRSHMDTGADYKNRTADSNSNENGTVGGDVEAGFVSRGPATVSPTARFHQPPVGDRHRHSYFGNGDFDSVAGRRTDGYAERASERTAQRRVHPQSFGEPPVLDEQGHYRPIEGADTDGGGESRVQGRNYARLEELIGELSRPFPFDEIAINR